MTSWTRRPSGTSSLGPARRRAKPLAPKRAGPSATSLFPSTNLANTTMRRRFAALSHTPRHPSPGQVVSLSFAVFFKGLFMCSARNPDAPAATAPKDGAEKKAADKKPAAKKPAAKADKAD